MISLNVESKTRKQTRAHIHREQMDGYQKLGWGWVGEMGEVGQKVQASSYKINKSGGCNVQHGNYS